MAGTPVHIKVRNRLKHTDNVSGATVSVSSTAAGGSSATGTTNASGIATLNLTGLTVGPFTLRVTPAHTTTDPVGPDIARTPPAPARIFRSLAAEVTLSMGRIATATVAPGQSSNGAVAVGSNPNLIVDLQPVWIASPNKHSRGSTSLDLIVVHHTAGPLIEPAINTFLSSSEKTSAHYVIDTDGQIVKMVRDEESAHQAGVSFWSGVNGVNDNSIGIEIVNRSGAYPAAQYTALLGLLDRLLAAHTGINRRRIVGHSDIATDGHHVLGRKSSDPGLEFEWTRLEARNLGMVPASGPPWLLMYGGFFKAVPAGSFRKGDNDSHHRFGGSTTVAGVTGTPVQEIQEDLRDIGYSVGTPDGDFGRKTEAAVEMFQEHFFSRPRQRGTRPDGRVDQATAEMIKRVRP
ncbi:MAG: N-acetylmuramoyl-L-alanine amidase [Isosphaeraceae bacterium]